MRLDCATALKMFIRADLWLVWNRATSDKQVFLIPSEPLLSLLLEHSGPHLLFGDMSDVIRQFFVMLKIVCKSLPWQNNGIESLNLYF